MVRARVARRCVLSGLLGVTGLNVLGLSATGLRAEEIVDLHWSDLVAAGQGAQASAVQRLGAHDEAAPLAASQPPSSGVRNDWNGRTVRLSGFIIPLDYKGTGVTAFMLVPYVGACIHVPPPPANQLVLVTTERPFQSKGLFAPVTVTGMFATASQKTQLAEVGYALSADHIAPYRG